MIQHPNDDEGRERRRWRLIGWGAATAVFSAGLAVVANLSEIAGWFAPDETREMVAQTRDTIADTDAKVDELVTLLRTQAAAAGMDLDLESEAAIRNAVEAIAVSSNRQKQTALARLETGDVDGAATMMKELAADQSSAASVTVETAAESWREAGALYYTLDIQQSVESYAEAHRLQPDDAGTLALLGHTLIRAGRLADAAARFEQARALDPDADALASLELGLGEIAKQRGEYAAAEAHYLGALSAAEGGELIEDRVNALNALGNLKRAQGALEAAKDYLRRALALAERSGNLSQKAQVLGALGIAAASRREFDEAERLMRDSLAIHEQRNDLAGKATMIGDLGALALLRNDVEAAESLLLESVALGERLGWQASIAYDLVNLAGIAGARKDFATADAQLERAHAIAADSGLAELEPVIVFNRGEIAWEAGRGEEACRYWSSAAPTLIEMGSVHAGQAEQRLADGECAAGGDVSQRAGR